MGDWCVFASSQAGALLAEVLTGDAVLTSGRDSLLQLDPWRSAARARRGNLGWGRSIGMQHP